MNKGIVMTRQRRSASAARSCLVVAVVVGAFAAALSQPAQAYVGPGLGLSSIGAILALLAAVFFAIVGFIWYPVKRLRQKRKGEKATPDSGEAPAQARAQGDAAGE